MQSFTKLRVWEKAHLLTLSVYKVSRAFPKEERYGLTSQIRWASASIGANIAERWCKRGDGEFGRFSQIAIGSASELEYHLMLARDLDLLAGLAYERLSSEVIDVK